MIHLVNYENKGQYLEILTQMHEQRKSIFMDKLKWDLTEFDGQEIDQFDTKDTIYLIAMDEENKVIRSSLRLNPTTKPHLMTEVLSNYCAESPPIDENIWEISRYCYNPNIKNRRDRFESMKQMMCGVMECSLLYGWTQLTFVINLPMLAHCLACGWDMTPLGLPKEEKGLKYAAFAINVNQEGLLAVRKNAGNTGPSLTILPNQSSAA